MNDGIILLQHFNFIAFVYFNLSAHESSYCEGRSLSPLHLVFPEYSVHALLNVEYTLKLYL